MGPLSSLDLADFPPIFILTTHLQEGEVHEAEDSLHLAGGHLTYQAGEARIFLGRVSQKKRAAFDLRANGVWTEEDVLPRALKTGSTRRSRGIDSSSPIVLSDSDDSHTKTAHPETGQKRKRKDSEQSLDLFNLESHIVVLKLDWLLESTKQGRVLPFTSYSVYCGRIVSKEGHGSPITPIKNRITYIKATTSSDQALPPSAQQREPSSGTLSDFQARPTLRLPGHFHRRRFGQKSTTLASSANPPKLHRTTTSEYEEANLCDLPPPPQWLLEEHPRPLYSCLRSTPALNPNHYFIAQLTKIKNARLLTLDEIGVRAYSTSIAALSAYPHQITSPLEITRLPGCDQKIATLWIEWRNSVSPTPSQQGEDKHTIAEADMAPALDAQRTIPIVTEIDNDQDMQVLHLFHEIWGVGPDTARKFYFQHGFRDLEDLVEFHWKQLARVQQIGVKYYDEFQVKIPRVEVESIARIVLQGARLARNIPREHWSQHSDQEVWPWDDPHGNHTHANDFVAIIVGGYRRGKIESGDVDIILTHRDEAMTHDLIIDVVRELETQGYITHTLTLNTTTSDRGGGTLPFRAQGHAGHGFDSLDKALCVWQDPQFDQTIASKNPNIHRRVDIIISSWKTIGCAIVGWSGGTTFQRDLRRWVKREKGWKFDSSGVRDRRDGRVLYFEEPTTDDLEDGWLDRERRLMEGIGVGWREPQLRCTG